MSIPESAPSRMNPLLARVQREVLVGLSGDMISAVQMLRGRGGAEHNQDVFENTGKLTSRACEEIDEYLEGTRRSFDLPLSLSLLTTFSREVLMVTKRIPYGETRSYGWVAARVGRPKAARAVGQALHRNPVPLLIP